LWQEASKAKQRKKEISAWPAGNICSCTENPPKIHLLSMASLLPQASQLFRFLLHAMHYNTGLHRQRPAPQRAAIPLSVVVGVWMCVVVAVVAFIRLNPTEHQRLFSDREIPFFYRAWHTPVWLQAISEMELHMDPID
jgi:hypothetical protein